MKVLLVTMAMGIGGAETHIVELAKGLCARGVEVHVASAGGVYVQALEQMGVRHVTLPLNRRRPLEMVVAERGLCRLIQSGCYDIVHAHARIPAFLCGRLRRKMGFRFVTTDHLDFVLTPLLRKMTDWGEHTFAVSADLRRYLLDNFPVNPDHVSLTVNGVDTVRFSPEAKADERRAEFEAQGRAVVLHISRLDTEVCICADALIDAIPLLEGRAMLVIVGDGSGRAQVQAHADAVNRGLGFRAIYLAGAQTDVQSFIAACDIVVAPSRAAMEGMASGKPTVIAGSQGYGGVFSETLERAAIASNLCFRGYALPTAEVLASDLKSLLLMDEASRHRLGLRCREFIERYFSVDRMVESQLAVYRRLAEYRTGGDADVVICGYYGYGNSGDEAILSVVIRELRRRIPDVRICVLSARPKDTAAYYAVDAVNRFDLTAIRRRLKKAKLFLFGGGSLLQDKTSTRSLAYYTSLIRMAKKCGASVWVFANGIGPVFRRGNVKRVREALLLCDHVSLRDRVSFGMCRSMTLPVMPTLTFDPAILLRGRGERLAAEDFYIVVPKNLGEEHFAVTVQVLLEHSEKSGCHPLVVSLFDAQDRSYAEKLATVLGARCISPRDGAEAIGLFVGARFVLSSRLHGLIYAASACVPPIALSDDEKLFSCMDRIGYPTLFCRSGEKETLACAIDEASLRYDEICIDLTAKLNGWRLEAEKEFDLLAERILQKRGT